MHAVVTRVSVQGGPEATQFLRERVVPAIQQAPGFQAGYWVRLEGGDQGTSVIVFESEDAARQAGEQMRANVGQNPGVTLDSMAVGEVVASA